MAAYLERPLTICVSGAEELSTREVILALQSIIDYEEIKCVTPTKKAGTWQITLATETSKDVVIGTGLDVNEQHYECYPLLNPRQRGPPPAYVTVKMPYEMSDNYVTDVLCKYGRVSKVYRRHYSFAPCTETGVRVFTVLDPYGSFPTSLRIGGYWLRFYVRYAGEPQKCYRCGSIEHQIRSCQHPPSYRRCYQCGGTDHVQRDCPSSALSDKPEEERSEDINVPVFETSATNAMEQSHTLINPSDDTVLSQIIDKPTDVIADMTMKPRDDTTPKVNEYNEDATTDDEMDNQSTFPEGETKQEDLRKRKRTPSPSRLSLVLDSKSQFLKKKKKKKEKGIRDTQPPDERPPVEKGTRPS